MATLTKVLSHFGLSAHPFERNVPSEGLYRHPSFVESLGRLAFAVEGRSPALLTAPPGTGKSILLEALRGSLLGSVETRFVYTALASCGPFGWVGQLAARYGTPIKRSTAQTATALLDELARSQRTEVLFLDEAHRLPDPSLEELRLLFNLDFDWRAPFCLILARQPAPHERLHQPNFDSLWQRLSIRSSLAPLTDRETSEYLDRRLRAVGACTSLFRSAAIASCSSPRGA